MTVRLYLDNSYCKKFTATVKKVKRENDLWAVILDKTAFFPTSGGQPHDTGWLNGKEVIDVFEDGEEVVHLIKEGCPSRALSPPDGRFPPRLRGYHYRSSFTQPRGESTY